MVAGEKVCYLGDGKGRQFPREQGSLAVRPRDPFEFVVGRFETVGEIQVRDVTLGIATTLAVGMDRGLATGIGVGPDRLGEGVAVIGQGDRGWYLSIPRTTGLW